MTEVPDLENTHILFFNKHHILPEFICESPDENGIASLVAEGFGIALVADVESIHRDDIIIKPLIPAETFSHTVYMGYLRDHYQLPCRQTTDRLHQKRSA